MPENFRMELGNLSPEFPKTVITKPEDVSADYIDLLKWVASASPLDEAKKLAGVSVEAESKSHKDNPEHGRSVHIVSDTVTPDGTRYVGVFTTNKNTETNHDICAYCGGDNGEKSELRQSFDCAYCGSN